MANDFPFKMRVFAQNAPSQLVFALEASNRVPAGECQTLVVTRSGLVVYAASEMDLEEVAQCLRDSFATTYTLDFGAPAVCFRKQNGQLLQPVMHLRIRARRAAVRDILQDLMERLAQVLEVDYQKQDVIVRAEVPALHLLGLYSNLRLLTQGLFELRSQVVQFEAVTEHQCRLPAASVPLG